MIYFDHAATTPMDPLVIDAVTDSMRNDFANSGSVYKIGLDAKVLIEEAIQVIRHSLHVPAQFRIIFTSGGSESNNLFIKGLGFPASKSAFLGLEHPSVVEALNSLKEPGRQPVSLQRFQKDGRLDLSAITALGPSGIRLLCLSHVNNELGSVNDPRAVVDRLGKESPQTRLFFDGVQAIGKIPIGPGFWDGISGYSISGHKLNGPKGIGLLIYDSRLNLTPLIHGGKQQYGVRAGTLPVPLILRMARSVKLAASRQNETRMHIKTLRRHVIKGLMKLAEDASNLELRFNSPLTDDISVQSPAIVNFSFSPVEGEVLLHRLEDKNIYVGMGSACSAHSRESSKILLGIGLSEEEARCSLRISFGLNNTIEEVDAFLQEFARAYEFLYPSFSWKSAKQ